MPYFEKSMPDLCNLCCVCLQNISYLLFVHIVTWHHEYKGIKGLADKCTVPNATWGTSGILLFVKQHIDHLLSYIGP